MSKNLLIGLESRLSELERQNTELIFERDKALAFAEEALRKSEARLQEVIATKDKIFSIIGHDLRNQLTSILGFSELLNEQVLELDKKSIEQFSEIIYSSVININKLLDNLLDWSKLQGGKIPLLPKKINLNHLVQNELQVIKNSADHKTISLEGKINSDIVLTADENMLKTCLRNLIGNAIKFTPRNGKVEVFAEVKDSQIEISVADNGIGISPEYKAKLFKIETSFTTRGTENERGTGMGLLLCKEFVEKHGGKIGVESQSGKGSRFFFTIPCQDTPIFAINLA